jgi:arylsulfatase A-like enzyme
MMTRRQFLATSAAASAGFAQPSAPRWNILFVLMDDLGWHDLAPYGNSVIETPNLTRLANEGARFTNAYAAAPVCSPTRASILTGQYPARLKLTDWIPGRAPWPWSRLRRPEFAQFLPEDHQTLAETLRPAGYRSASIGKWHLGGAEHSPDRRGFDKNIGGTAAGSPPSYFGPLELPNLKLAPQEFLTERLTNEGIAFLQSNREHPFFLYQAHYTVHLPLEAREQAIAKYKARDTRGIEPAYCAMVENADESVGQLMRALDESRLSDRTIVVITSDNGGARYQERRLAPVTDNAPLRAGKGHIYEGGIRVPLFIRWPSVTKPGSVVATPVSSIDFVPTLCAAAGVAAPRCDGVDLRRVFSGSAPERPLFWHYPHYSDQGGKPSGAIRLGDWKLIEFFEDNRLELFDLRSDPGERRNLIRKEPRRAKQLHEMLRDWRASVGAVMPAANPDYDPARSGEGLSGYENATEPA